MKTRVTITALFLSMAFFNCTESHEPNCFQKIEFLINDYQKELDTGIDMLETNKKYWVESDSLLERIHETALENDFPSEDSLLQSYSDFRTKRSIVQDSLWNKGKEIMEETGIFPELEQMIMYSELITLNTRKAKEYCEFLEKNEK